MKELTHLSLFSGIGGLDLAAEWAGFRTVGQCEWADYPHAVLQKHWPDVPKWRDIHTLTKEGFRERTGLDTVTVLSGGFPCQPFSTAGKRRGKEDDRYLWPEMLRVIQEIRPTWVVGENVAGLVSLALDTVLSDLESIGYACQTLIIPACAVDAPHRRDRCAIVAHTNTPQTPRQREHGGEIHPEPETERPILCGGHVAGPKSQRCQRNRGTRQQISNSRCPEAESSRSSRNVPDTDDWCRDVWGNGELPTTEKVGGWGENFPGRTPEHGGREWWPAEPNVGRVAYGVPSRVDRLRCLGNAVVPQQFYPIFRAIADVEAAL